MPPSQALTQSAVSMAYPSQPEQERSYHRLVESVRQEGGREGESRGGRGEDSALSMTALKVLDTV